VGTAAEPLAALIAREAVAHAAGARGFVWGMAQTAGATCSRRRSSKIILEAAESPRPILAMRAAATLRMHTLGALTFLKEPWPTSR
jgi:hypothetical protein